MSRKKKRDHLTNVFGDLVDMKKFEERQIEQPNGCIEYSGINHVQGYQFVGRIRDDKSGFITAHRLAMKLKLGRDLDRKEQVIHSCSNVKCVNHAHLFVGDTKDRVKVMFDNDRAPKNRNTPKRNTMQNRKYRYPLEDMIYFRTHTSAEISEKYGWDKSKASRIKCGFTHNYKWLDNYVNKEV